MLRSPIRIEFFGNLCVKHGKRSITRFRTYKTGVLLAYLAFYPRLHPREELIEMLWTDCDPLLGRNSLSQSLSSLRHQLEPPGVAGGEVLQADRYNVRLNPETYISDLKIFEENCRTFQTAENEPMRAAAFSALSQIYKGEFLTGFYEDWNLRERERLKDEFLQILLRRSEQFEEQDDLNSAIEFVRRAVGIDALNEEIHLRLIRLHAANKNPGHALLQFEELRKIFENELGIEPSEETRNLAKDLRAGIAETVKSKSVSEKSKKTKTSEISKSNLPSGILAMLAIDSAKVKNAGNLQKMFQRFGGNDVKTDSEISAAFFGRASDALNCAVRVQRDFDKEIVSIKFAPKMALHLGEIRSEKTQISPNALREILDQTLILLNYASDGQFLCSETAAVLLRQALDPNVKLRDLGSFQLKTKEKAEHIYQADYEGRFKRDFPELQISTGFDSNLPLQLSRFFGREAEIKVLRELLNPKNSDERLITITGPGGTGKTRLSLETARNLQSEYRNAVWFISLAAIKEPRLIPNAILEALKLPAPAAVDALKYLIPILSREKTLLVLDNFEHFLPEDSEEISGESIAIVRTLLEQIPNLHCLVTSRRRLGLFGEHEFFLEPLPIPFEKDSLEEASWCESVQLFTDRAQTVRPTFQITKTNVEIVSEICRKLEGIPLALELAAAQIQIYTPTQILKSLTRRFDFLTDRKRQAEIRHQQLRATIDWSFQMLAPETQAFFASLSIFRGGGNLSDVEAVCDAPLALDYLAALQDFSFLRIEENEIVNDMRFRLLETLREYGSEKLSPEERDFLRERHARHYLSFAEACAPFLKGGKQIELFKRFEQEHQNFLTALDWWLETENVEPGLRLIAILSAFWELYSYVRPGREKLNAFLELADGKKISKLVRAKALSSAGSLGIAASDFAAARKFNEEALKLFEEENNAEGRAQALTDIGRVAFEQGDYETGRAAGNESLKLWLELKNDYGAAISYNTLGLVACEQGNYSKSLDYYEKSLKLRRSAEDRRGVATQLNNFGVVYRRQGNYEAARKVFSESLAIRRELKDKRQIGICLSNLGFVAENEQDYENARNFLEESLAIRYEVGDQWGIARTFAMLGVVAHHQGDDSIAQKHFEESLTRCRQMGNKLGIAQTLCFLGDLFLEKNVLEKAQTFLTESLEIMSALKNKQGLTDVLQAFAKFALLRKQNKIAAEFFFAAANLRQTIGAKLPPYEQNEIDSQLSKLQSNLSAKDFQNAKEKGSKLTVEDAIELTTQI